MLDRQRLQYLEAMGIPVYVPRQWLLEPVSAPEDNDGETAAAASAQQQTDPVSDSRGSAEYKRAMAGVFVQRAVEQAWKQAQATLYQ